MLDANYRAVMRARQQKASQPKRTIMRVNQDVGTLNRMASGVTTHAQASKFAAFTVSSHQGLVTVIFPVLFDTLLGLILMATYLDTEICG